MNTSLVSFNNLSLSDLYSILQLRETIFILEQTCLYQDIDGKDPLAYHMLIKDNNQVVAYARYFPKSVYYSEYASIGRVLVHPDYRKKRLGHLLLERLLQEVEVLYGDIPIQISAQTYLVKFYQKYGFNKISAEYLEDNIPHIRMLKS